MKSVDTYLNFAGNTLEAFEFYRSVFGGEFESRFSYADFGGAAAGHAEGDLDRIANISLRLTPDFVLMGSDVPTKDVVNLRIGSNSHINLNVDSEEEARRIYDALAQGGKAEHPLEKTSWADQYGSLVDKFGVRWMVNLWS